MTKVTHQLKMVTVAPVNEKFTVYRFDTDSLKIVEIRRYETEVEAQEESKRLNESPLSPYYTYGYCFTSHLRKR